MEDNMFFYPRYPFGQEWEEENYRKVDIKPINNIFTPKETMEYGNIFREEYVPYLNYQPRKLIPSNDNERRMYEVMAMRDFCHDLKLYLDVYPNSKEIRNLYEKSVKQYEEMERMINDESVCCPGYGPGNGRKYDHFSIPDWILWGVRYVFI